MRLTLLQRHLQTLQTYLATPLQHHFLSQEYLKGIASRREEIAERQSRVMKTLMILTAVLISIETANITVGIFGSSIQLTDALRMPLAVLLSIGVLVAFLVTFDAIILQSYIDRIGHHGGLASMQVIMAQYTARDLWSDVFSPKILGLRSGRGHKIAYTSTLIILIAILAVVFSIPIGTVLFSCYKAMQDGTFFEKLLAGASIFILAASVFILLMMMIRFKFDEAHFGEWDGQPTEEFYRKLQDGAKS